jgi:hypothetical protein
MCASLADIVTSLMCYSKPTVVNSVGFQKMYLFMYLFIKHGRVDFGWLSIVSNIVDVKYSYKTKTDVYTQRL